MNFKKAVSIIKNRSRWKIISIDWKKQEVTCEGIYGSFQIYDARQFISWARSYQSYAAKKSLKHFGRRKNRRETRDLINKGDFDSIPQQGRCKDDDIWNWD